MIKTVITASLAAAIAYGAGLAHAQGTFEAWGHTFDLEPFQPKTLDVTVATHKATGDKMNLIRLKNGHLMALVSADKYVGLMSGTPKDDMAQ